LDICIIYLLHGLHNLATGFTHLKHCYFIIYHNGFTFNRKSQDSLVGMGTGYRLGDQGVRVRVLVETRIFTSPFRPDRLWGPPNLLSKPGTLSLVVKRQGRVAGHSPPTSAEVKKIWIYTSTPPYAFTGTTLPLLPWCTALHDWRVCANENKTVFWSLQNIRRFQLILLCFFTVRKKYKIN
jgi:hypothetical protein